MDVDAYNYGRRVGMEHHTAVQYAEYVEKKRKIKETGRSAKKDSTRNRVYEAEYQFEELCAESIGSVLTEDEAVKYVGRITQSKLWKDLTGGKSIGVSFMKRMENPSTAGVAFGSSIKLAPMCVTKYVILHELTHCVGHMHHDVAFRKCILKLVSRFLGREPSKILKNCFKEAGLKMSRKTTILDPGAWMAAKEKMARLRGMK